MKCDRDCFNCKFSDCINDELTFEEMKESELRDKSTDIVLSDDPRIRWAQLNPERNRTNKHRHYEQNKERYLNNHKSYHKQHREELNRKRKERYQANREYELARQKAYRMNKERQVG